MNSIFRGAELIEQLLANPAQFYAEGKSHELLQELFRGFPILALRPLLSYSELTVRRVAVWTASELGPKAAPLTNVVIPLLLESDRYVRYHALEIVMVCSQGASADKFVHVVEAITDEDPVICSLAMRLVVTATDAQLQAALDSSARFGSAVDLHRQGLTRLLAIGDNSRDDVLSMLMSCARLTRIYGALIAKRVGMQCADLIEICELDRRDRGLEQFLMNGHKWGSG